MYNNINDTIFEKSISFNSILNLVKDNKLYRCRFLKSELSKPVDLSIPSIQNTLQKMVHGVLNNDEIQFLREDRILLTTRKHKNNLYLKYDITDNGDKPVEILPYKYTFIIQYL
ncbi:hypothetical protein DLAC_11461 [Tieghemostelium lacteum]|uniref:Uncharacterized protein n=1 Tax=Tieghemostelium lacteum TaxID=361077 RepID=A0A152A8A4_TIELA|nr:hypothetical protein DLAC_11461 [Tieghemostelium lacteum]|eukprot:KYR02277.1 hypothetical protein DLAC_11461 [Tieghemostelium lacteum]